MEPFAPHNELLSSLFRLNYVHRFENQSSVLPELNESADPFLPSCDPPCRPGPVFVKQQSRVH